MRETWKRFPPPGPVDFWCSDRQWPGGLNQRSWPTQPYPAYPAYPAYLAYLVKICKDSTPNSPKSSHDSGPLGSSSRPSPAEHGGAWRSMAILELHTATSLRPFRKFVVVGFNRLSCMQWDGGSSGTLVHGICMYTVYVTYRNMM